jgi:hypothetical protein
LKRVLQKFLPIISRDNHANEEGIHFVDSTLRIYFQQC